MNAIISTGRFALPLIVLLLLFCLPLMPETSQAGTETRYYYVGTIGEDLPVQMELVVDSGSITGLYFYEKSGIPISLSGQADLQALTFNITEQDEEGIKSGEFKGKLSSEEDPFGKTIEGEWTKANGITTLPFKLTKVSDFLSSEVRQGGYIEASFSVPYFLTDVEAYRFISNEIQKEAQGKQSEFLKQAREFFDTETSASGWQQSYNYTIEYYSQNLISMSGEVYSYSGGAHGNTNFISLNYWIREGKAVELELADLFLPNSGYMKVLSDYCINDLRKKGAGWVVNGEIKSLTEKDLSVFALSPRNITFAFAPYAVGSYAEGPYFVQIPYSELEPVLNAKGPLKPFLEKESIDADKE
jgi:hypothetical protein